jgi:hypothetical protein
MGYWFAQIGNGYVSRLQGRAAWRSLADRRGAVASVPFRPTVTIVLYGSTRIDLSKEI